MKITEEKQNVMLNEAKMSSFICEYISQFHPEDIDGDDIDLRFEVAGIDTGCDISIVEQFGKTAAVIDKLLAHIDAQAACIAELENDEVRQRLANAEHQLYMKDLAIHNVKASRRAQFRARQAAEKELAALREQNPKLEYIRSLEKGLSVLRKLAAPVAVPDEGLLEKTSDVSLLAWQEGWDACIAEVLRLNSGSK